jgi:hypothetical protein
VNASWTERSSITMCVVGSGNPRPSGDAAAAAAMVIIAS